MYFIQEKEKIQLVFNMIKSISHHWKQPLSVISAISSGCTFKKELNIELNEEDINNLHNITIEVDKLSDILGELEQINFDTISLEKIESIINISNPLFENE